MAEHVDPSQQESGIVQPRPGEEQRVQDATEAHGQALNMASEMDLAVSMKQLATEQFKKSEHPMGPYAAAANMQGSEALRRSAASHAETGLSDAQSVAIEQARKDVEAAMEHPEDAGKIKPEAQDGTQSAA